MFPGVLPFLDALDGSVWCHRQHSFSVGTRKFTRKDRVVSSRVVVAEATGGSPSGVLSCMLSIEGCRWCG